MPNPLENTAVQVLGALVTAFGMGFGAATYSEDRGAFPICIGCTESPVHGAASEAYNTANKLRTAWHYLLEDNASAAIKFMDEALPTAKKLQFDYIHIENAKKYLNDPAINNENVAQSVETMIHGYYSELLGRGE